jgi:hypothetical protein
MHGRITWAALIGCLILCTACAGGRRAAVAAPAGQLSTKEWSGVRGRTAVLYTREVSVGHGRVRQEILWQDMTERKTARCVYRTGPTNAYYEIPSDFGFLPSPDGHWLLIWVTPWDEHFAQSGTRWLVVNTRNGRSSQIARASGEGGYLPYWLDARRVALEKGDKRLVFDVLTRARVGALPPAYIDRYGPTRDIDSQHAVPIRWRHDYLARHYAPELQCLRSALRSLEAQLQVADYLLWGRGYEPDTPEDLLLRPLRVVDRTGYNAGKSAWPSIACSPDGKRIARAVVLPGRRIGVGGAAIAAGAVARIDVFALPSGERLWGEAINWQRALIGDVVGGAPARLREPFFADVRWSPDGKYLSYSVYRELRMNGEASDAVSVVDAVTWREVFTAVGATSAFVVPGSDRPRQRARAADHGTRRQQAHVRRRRT